MNNRHQKKQRRTIICASIGAAAGAVLCMTVATMNGNFYLAQMIYAAVIGAGVGAAAGVKVSE